MSIEAMKQALEALEYDNPSGRTATISALRAAIEQAEKQEPVAWMCSDPALLDKGYLSFSRDCRDSWNIPVYLAPPPRQWQGLTKEERRECIQYAIDLCGTSYSDALAKAIEFCLERFCVDWSRARLKEKNT